MTQDQVHVPHTRSELGLKPLDSAREDRLGARVSEEVKKELWEALGDSPIGAVYGCARTLLGGWPAYILFNVSGQARYPSGTNRTFLPLILLIDRQTDCCADFSPKSIMFSPHHRSQVVLSDIGVVFWLAAIGFSINFYGLLETFRVYLVPYLWYAVSGGVNVACLLFLGSTTGLF